MEGELLARSRLLLTFVLMASKRIYKRDSCGRFASSGTTRARRVGRKINRKRPRYVRGSAGKTVRVGRVGPGGEYSGIHVRFANWLRSAPGDTARCRQPRTPTWLNGTKSPSSPRIFRPPPVRCRDAVGRR